jgi:CHAT domain-containing protein
MELYNNFLKFSEYYHKQDFKNAEKVMLNVINYNQQQVPEIYLVTAYINLGIVNIPLSRFDDALDCFSSAEEKISDKAAYAGLIADIYVNKARVYTMMKSYDVALDYLEKGLKTYLKTDKPDKNGYNGLAATYLNIGLVYYSTGDYSTALKYFFKSAGLKEKKDLSNKALASVNIAKTYFALNKPVEAEKYFKKSISLFKSEFGEEYYRMAEMYFDYGLFLESAGRYDEELDAYRKALKICLKNYGQKHTLVSLAYKHVADHFLNQNLIDSSLYYYQKSLISVVRDFNNPDILANPSIDSVIFDLRLLDNLKSKSAALRLASNQKIDREDKILTLLKSYETITITVDLIDRISKNSLTDENKIYLTDNEKQTYINTIEIASELYKLTRDDKHLGEMYDLVKKVKAALLTSEIKENELAVTSELPDSLINKRKMVTENIAAYNNLIMKELTNKRPDSAKISIWKDTLFDMNRESEKIIQSISSGYPRFNELLEKSKPISLKEIQKRLNRDETIIDYFLADRFSEGKKKIFIFTVSRKDLTFYESELDSLFIKNAGIIRNNNQTEQLNSGNRSSFREYTSALLYMYDNLIKPVEACIVDKRVILIPDEELNYLPFDAFLRSIPLGAGEDFEGLDFLVYHYSTSFLYSSSLIPEKKIWSVKPAAIYAYAPVYNDDPEINSLPGASEEINEIMSHFGGRTITGSQATETGFKEDMDSPVVFHLAMHALPDSSDSRYSYLQFSNGTDTINDGKLYDYEVSLSRIHSPLVVLSACNSGTGKLYHGEGLMSLARSFILAGASSVIKTGWGINDETSSELMDRFYHHLSLLRTKDEALRLAKIDFIRAKPPVYANPYYWSSYTIVGDNSRIFQRKTMLGLTLIILTSAIIIAGILYLRRRKIFLARAL